MVGSLTAGYVVWTGNAAAVVDANVAERCPRSRRVCARRARPTGAGRHGPGGTDERRRAGAPDPLGRSTPRGTVLGFLNAARKGENELARQYLDTRLSGKPAEDLAHQLFVVLDAKLPARLTLISDAPEGSRSNPLRPDQDVVGTVTGEGGPIPILVERIRRPKEEPIWLFSSTTLDSIPSLYQEVSTREYSAFLPEFLKGARVRRFRLGEWLIVLLAIPIAYFATGLLNRLLVPLARPIWRRLLGDGGRQVRTVLPVPARLLLLSLLGRWLLSSLSLSLLVRQFWSNIARMVTIVAVVWLLIVIAGKVEQYVQRRIPSANFAAAQSLLRLSRRAVELLFVFAGLLAMLRHFGVDPTPALAGLGVGGIAVALAAQKTLENVIAGASLIFDQAVRVGDSLKMGEIVGTVDHIGLRSTRIRTLDRTVVSVPNGQIANASLETLSARDKFWFHPVVTLRYETTSDQLRVVLDGIRNMLETHAAVDRRVDTCQVRPARRVFPRRRGRGLSRRARLGPLSRASGTTAFRHHRDRRTSGHRNCLSIANDVRRRSTRRAGGEASHRPILTGGSNTDDVIG